jgi:hypothetical protein
VRRIVAVIVALAGAVVALGCPESNDRPDVACADECKVQLTASCSPHECERGCAFVLDRLVEHEQGTVLACMKGKKVCDDATWAECAARVGPHVDGGPGVPPSSTAEAP